MTDNFTPTTMDPNHQAADIPTLAALVRSHAMTLTTPGALSPDWAARIGRDLVQIADSLDRLDRSQTASQTAPQPTAQPSGSSLAVRWQDYFAEPLSPAAQTILLDRLGGDLDLAYAAMARVHAALASGTIQRPRSLLSYVVRVAQNLKTGQDKAQPTQPKAPIGYPAGMVVIRDMA